MGSTRSALDSYMDSKPSVFDPVSQWIGFKRWLNGERGQALPPAERERVLRHAANVYSTLKTPIAVRAGHTVTSDDLQAFVKVRLGSVKTPKQVEIWSDLPRSKIGKVLKSDIKARLG